MKIKIDLKGTDIEFEDNKAFIDFDNFNEKVVDTLMQERFIESTINIEVECEYNVFGFGNRNVDEETGEVEYQKEIEVDFTRFETEDGRVWFNSLVLD